jgi:hypothetical protein
VSDRSSSVNMVTRLRDGRPGFDFRQWLGCFLLAIASRPALVSTQPPIKWVQGVKQPGRETDHSLHLVSILRILELYLHFPTRLHGVVLS